METKLNIASLKSWNVNNSHPLIIAGPCSAETEEQVLQTAMELAKHNVHVFRAGVWKPRTRPDHFEGVGSKGLEWLQKVKLVTGMLTATEVANAKHVYEAIKYGVDILWIGARTTVNPFTIQEIAEALKGTDIPLLVKNPVNADLELWIGAIERFNKCGITRIAAVHRGFSTYEKNEFRNPPKWQIVIDLKRRLPRIPVICDPSHMGGKKSLLAELSQKALDLNYDGLMIESHIDPKNALSDAEQQLTPAELGEMLINLEIRKPNSGNKVFINILEELRTKIDNIDDELVDILGKRMQVVETIGRYKRQNNITILQTQRWEEIINKRVEQGLKKGLDENFMHKILKAIHQESINHQTRIMNPDLVEEINDAIFKW